MGARLVVAIVAMLAAIGCDRLLGLDPIPSQPDAPLPAVAHYDFEELGSGATCLYDVTGNGHDGACAMGRPTLVAGPPGHGHAFAFDGATYLAIPYSAELDPTTGFTVAFWVAVDGYDPVRGGDCIVNRPVGELGADSWQLCTGPTGGFCNFGSAPANLPVLTSDWQHVALVWDGLHAAGWVNGVLQSLNLTMPPVFDPSWGIWIGADAEPDPEVFLIGRIDELYIYDRALSEKELEDLAR